ncbi:putative acetyltransferase [Arthrobacter woluwensis]|uniref:GNAT family N-acetyltransferase n=1 Tax=Arthrobacter woluwensis TaxID=156980 RepID=UPI0027805CAC|nr:N-acetyltransferase [Arthrobacter woluwensis]MDQ0709851.1 putative acetyltransferase [Arthrobacter woluwensis]
MPLLIRPETPEDFSAIRTLTAAAFRGAPHAAPPVDGTSDPGEAALVEWLREDSGYVPELALVAEEDGVVVGHIMTTRGTLDGDGAPPVPALGLGPLSVLPAAQRRGVGAVLLAATVDAAVLLGEPLIALLGAPGYYGRHGWVAAARHGIGSPDPAWGDYFQVRLLPAYDGEVGTFRYAEPFSRFE